MAFKVLIVEDSRASREFIRAAVEAVEGLEAVGVDSSFEAMKRLPRERFDLIITDVNMPDMNGLELIRFVRSSTAHRNVPLFVVTTEGREEDRERALDLGATEYLTKPFKPQDLQVLLKRYLST